MTQLINKLIRNFKGCVTALEEYQAREETKAKPPSTFQGFPQEGRLEQEE